MHIKKTQMPVLCLVGNNGRSILRKSKKRNFTEVEVETLVGEMEARKVVLFGGHGIGIANKQKAE